MTRLIMDEETALAAGAVKIEGREGFWKPQEDITVKYHRRPAALEGMSKIQFCKMYARRKKTEKNESDCSSSDEESEGEEEQKAVIFQAGMDEAEFYSNYVVISNNNGELLPGIPLPQWIELADGTTMKKRGYSQAARYHKASADKKDAFYLQQLLLFVPHRAEHISGWEDNPGPFYLESSKQICRVSSIVMEHLESVQVSIMNVV